MYAHVQTYRLSTSAEVEAELEAFDSDEIDTISDQAARTIASWYQSPDQYATAITALSHGLPFDTTQLAEELERNHLYPNAYVAMRDWLTRLEDILSGNQ